MRPLSSDVTIGVELAGTTPVVALSDSSRRDSERPEL